jgi:CHAD domain-containing protein
LTTRPAERDNAPVARARVIVVEDHPIFRDGLVQCLDGEPDFRVVGQWDTGDLDAADVVRRAPELALMDIELPGGSGIDATRRLRAALRIFAAGIPTGLHRTLSRKLQWLGRLLGQVRDLDVQLARLDDFTTTAPAGFRPALGCLRDYMEKKRERCRAEMLAGLDSPRYVRLLLQLETFAHAPAGGRPRAAAAREPIATAGRRAIKKAFRRLRQRGKGIKAMPRPEDLHALRMRAKRLRYLLEFLSELTGKPGRRLVRRLTALQNLLGSYHDAVVAADIARVYVETLGRQLAPSQIVALGALVATELRVAEQKRADFESTWRRFARRRTAADCRAVVRRLRNLQPPAPETGVGARAIEVHEPPEQRPLPSLGTGLREK